MLPKGAALDADVSGYSSAALPVLHILTSRSLAPGSDRGSVYIELRAFKHLIYCETGVESSEQSGLVSSDGCYSKE